MDANPGHIIEVVYNGTYLDITENYYFYTLFYSIFYSLPLPKFF